jgi:hypothetical protein
MAGVRTPAKRNWTVVVFVLILVSAVLAGAGRLKHETKVAREIESAGMRTPPPAATDRIAAPEIRTHSSIKRDADGWVTEIVSAHPTAALATFCDEATPASACASLDVTPSKPKHPGRRLGVFTLDLDERTWSVPIRRMGNSGDWTIGTGLRPITPTSPTIAGEESVWPHVREPIAITGEAQATQGSAGAAGEAPPAVDPQPSVQPEAAESGGLQPAPGRGRPAPG